MKIFLYLCKKKEKVCPIDVGVYLHQPNNNSKEVVEQEVGTKGKKNMWNICLDPISRRGQRLTSSRYAASSLPGVIPAGRQVASVSRLLLNFRYQPPPPGALKQGIDTAAVQENTTVIHLLVSRRTCPTLIEMSPNREKAIKLTEWFNSLLRELCRKCAAILQ